MMSATLLLLFAGLLGQPTAPPPVKVVTSLTTYGAIAREIVGDKGTVTSIAQGDEDPHFVQPKPSFVAILRNADLFVTREWISSSGYRHFWTVPATARSWTAVRDTLRRFGE